MGRACRRALKCVQVMFAVDVPMDGGAFVGGFALEFSPFYRYIDRTEKPDETCQTLGKSCKKGAGIHFPGTYMNDDLKREARSLIEKIVNLRDSL